MPSVSVGDAYVSLSVDVDGLKLGFQQAQQQTDSLLSSLQQRVQSFGSTTGGGVASGAGRSGIIGAMLWGTEFEAGIQAVRLAETAIRDLGSQIGQTVQAGADFQALMVRIQNNTTLSDQGVQAMRQSVLSLAADTGAPMAQLADGFMHLANLTGNATAAQAELKVATESAVATGTNAADTANVLGKAMHEYGLDVSTASSQTAQMSDITGKAANTMGVLHLAAAEGNMTLQQFSDSSGRAIATAAALGVPLEQVSAAMAALTNHGEDAAQAGNALNSLFTRLVQPSKQAETAIQALSKASGVDLAADFSTAGLATKGITGLLDDLRQAFTNAGYSTTQANQAIEQIAPAMRGGRELMVLMNQGASDYARILADVSDKQKTANITLDTQNAYLDTAQGQWNVLKGHLGDVRVEIGEALVPALTALLKGVNSLGPDFEDFGNQIRKVDANAKGLTDALQNLMDADTRAGTSLHATVAGWVQDVGGIQAVTGAIAQLGAAVRSLPGAQGIGQQFSDLGTMIANAGNRAEEAARPSLSAGYFNPTPTGNYSLGGMEARPIPTPASQADIAQAQADQARAAALQMQQALIKGNDQAVKDLTRSEAALNAEIGTATRSYEDQLKPLQSQLTNLQEQYQTRRDRLQASIDQTTAGYERQLRPLRDQLASLQAQHEAQAGPLQQSMESIRVGYERQLLPLQTQLDSLTAAYNLQRDKLTAAADDVKNHYQGMLEPLQQQLDMLTTAHTLAVTPLEDRVASIQGTYNPEIADQQRALDQLNQRFQRDSQQQAARVQDTQRAFQADLQSHQDSLDRVNADFAAAQKGLQASIDSTTAKYQQQLDPLQRQLDLMKQETQQADQQLKLTEQLATDRNQAALMAAQGDPTTRGTLQAQLDINKLHEDRLVLLKQQSDLQDKIAKPGTEPQDAALYKLQLQDTRAQLQLLGMVDDAKTQQLIKERDVAAAIAQQADAEQKVKDTQEAIAELPLARQVQQLTDAQKLALQPLQDQLKVLTAQHDLAVGPLDRAIKGIQLDQRNTMATLQAQTDELNRQHELQAGKLTASIQALQLEEYSKLTPIQKQLDTLNLQYKLASDPLKSSILTLQTEEKGRLGPIEDQLQRLQVQYNTNSGPLKSSIQGLQDQEKLRLAPIQLQLDTLNAQLNVSSAPLKESIRDLQTEETTRLRPMQDQLKALTDQEKEDTDPLKAAIKGLQDAETARLGPMKDQLQNLKDQIQAAKDYQDAWKNWSPPSMAGGPGTAAGEMVTPTSAQMLGGQNVPNLNQPGKQRSVFDNDPNVKATFVGYTAQQMNLPQSDPRVQAAAESTWKQQSGAGAGGPDFLPYTGAGKTGLSVVQRTAPFLDSFAYQDAADTYCERFVANIEGRAVQDTAYAAYQKRVAEAVLQVSFPPPPGAEVYFAPDAANKYEGHVGISLGDGSFRSVTNSGIKDYSIQQWSQNTWGGPYLGWVPAETPMYLGGGQMPSDGLAYLHSGEMVVSQALSRALQSGGMGYREVERILGSVASASRLPSLPQPSLDADRLGAAIGRTIRQGHVVQVAATLNDRAIADRVATELQRLEILYQHN